MPQPKVLTPQPGVAPPLDGKWSARRGQYRIIYTIDTSAQVVTVLHVSHRHVSHRRDAYR